MNAANPHPTAELNSYRLPNDPEWPDQMKSLAMTYVKQYDSCSQSILWAFMQEMKLENPMVLRAGGAMQGGMMSSLTCGVHTAGMMILGLLLGRERLETGLDGMMPIIMPAQGLMQRLTQRIGGHSCLAMTGVDFLDLEAAMAYKLSDRHDQCVERVGEGAKVIAETLQELNADGELFRATF